MRLRPLDRLLRLTPADRLLLSQSVVLLGAARLGLWLLPLTVVRRLLARTAPTPSGALATPERIAWAVALARRVRSEEHTSELQSLAYLVCRLLLEKKKNYRPRPPSGLEPASIFGERPALKSYGASDCLPSERIESIVQDSRGFLLF